MKLYFATLFDINYLSRGLVLYESLSRWHNDFILYIICLDEKVQNYFLDRKLDNIELITLSEIEKSYSELLTVKSVRSNIDYIFTLSPYYPSYILKKNPSIPFICSLDCDQYFFGNCEFLFEDLKTHDILITPHRFTKELIYHTMHGEYNVSFQVFKNNEIGNSCLELWRRQCLEWCSDIPEGDKYADQKYLDTWSSYFGDSIKAINHVGLGLAPWNLNNYKISRIKGETLVDGQKLILYHYQGLRFVMARIIQSGLMHYNIDPSPALTRFILKPIIKALYRYKYKRGMDSIARNKQNHGDKFLDLITSKGMFYVAKGVLINLNFVYEYKLKKLKLHGLYSKLKNVYR